MQSKNETDKSVVQESKTVRRANCVKYNLIGVTKIPVVPVSYREKIRVGRSEINFFFNIFFMVLAVF
jgi:hypothetical protein